MQIYCPFSVKAKRNVRNWQALSVFCFLGGFQRRAPPPLALGHPIGARSIPVGGGIQRGRRSLGRKNPKKPAVSWQGIQWGQRPLGTRLCLQSIVCYTFAKGRLRAAGFCPTETLDRKLSAALWMHSIHSIRRSLTHPRSKGIYVLSFCLA